MSHARQEQVTHGGSSFFGQAKPDIPMQIDACRTYKRFEDSAKSTLSLSPGSSSTVVPPAMSSQPSLYQQPHVSHGYQQDSFNGNNFAPLAHRAWDGSFSGSNHRRTNDASSCFASRLHFPSVAVPNFNNQIIEPSITSTTSLPSSSFSSSWGDFQSLVKMCSILRQIGSSI